ncbi:MAG: site-specific integrase [Hyphomicrobiaceae bacterium]|nr:site-specific integrase [Hyphomicrobiaceae bacterium]
MTDPLRKKLTLTVINTMSVNTTVWDTEIRGFCARRQKGPAITYTVKTRVQGAIRWLRIGKHGYADGHPEGHIWTPETARKQAIRLLADPTLADKAPPPPVDSTRFDVVADQFLATHGAKKKPRTLEEYARLIRLYLKPAFGDRPIAAIDRPAVYAAHVQWQEHKRAANHALAVLSKLMSWAEDQGLRPEGSNPCLKIDRYEENHRERYLTVDELGRLGAALDQAEADGIASLPAIAAIRLLIVTGARLSEILTLEWGYIDFERQIAFLPDSKTGKKPLSLNSAAVDILTSLPRLDGNPFVIPGHVTGQRLINIQKPWRRIRALAGLDALRIHDLRHTFASHAVASGASLPIIGRQLGHRQPVTTQRYAHLADDPVRQMTETTGQKIMDAMRRKHVAS